MPLSGSGRRVRAGLRRTFASLSVRNYRWYFAGRLISASGTSIAGVVEAWWLADRTGSGLWLGLFVTAWAVPMLLGLAWAGLLADRVSKRRLLLITEIGLMVNETALWCLSANDMIRPWVLVIAAFTWSTVNTLASPARESFASELVDTDRLPNAVALNGLIGYVASIAGAAAAGLIIVHWDVTMGWAASALSSAALLVALSAIDNADLHRRPPVPRAPRQLRAALGAVRADPALWIPLCSVSLIATLSLNLGTLVPLLASETHGNVGTYAALQTGIAVGCAAGALATAALPRSVPAVVLTAAGVLGALEALAAAGSSFALQLTALAGVGALSAVFLTAVSSHLQLRAPSEMRGRIIALYGLGLAGSSLIGGLLSGWLADRWSARAVLLAGGIAALSAAVAASLAFALAKIRSMPARTEEPDQTNPYASEDATG